VASDNAFLSPVTGFTDVSFKETTIYIKIHFPDSPIKESPGQLSTLAKLIVNPAACYFLKFSKTFQKKEKDCKIKLDIQINTQSSNGIQAESALNIYSDSCGFRGLDPGRGKHLVQGERPY
jgi:hypothetical protein